MATKQVFESVNDIGMDIEENKPIVQRWLDRGDGCAVYENVEIGHPECGHRKYVSYGSKLAQLEVAEPPDRLPDIGATVNWRYYLVGVIPPKKKEVPA